MEIKMQGGVNLPQTLPGARSADFPAMKKPQETNAGAARLEQALAVQEKAADAARFEQLQRAAESYFKDVYAVSDTTFSIFKDATGQYITRFTSLRDGKVTYTPEPQLVQYMQRRQQARQSLVEIQA